MEDLQRAPDCRQLDRTSTLLLRHDINDLPAGQPLVLMNSDVPSVPVSPDPANAPAYAAAEANDAH